MFVTFEGGDGSGKTTLIEGVFRHLVSLKRVVLKTREPGGTPLGEKVRSLLLQGDKISPYAELALFLSSRAEHVAEVILPALELGKVVLCDRFHDSSVAYQGIARGLGKQEVEQMSIFLSQGLIPDVTFYLDLDPALGLKRLDRSRAPDRIEQENLSFHSKIRSGYLELVKDHPSRMVRLDASLPKERVLKDAIEHLTLVMSSSHV